MKENNKDNLVLITAAVMIIVIIGIFLYTRLALNEQMSYIAQIEQRSGTSQKSLDDLNKQMVDAKAENAAAIKSEINTIKSELKNEITTLKSDIKSNNVSNTEKIEKISELEQKFNSIEERLVSIESKLKIKTKK